MPPSIRFARNPLYLALFATLVVSCSSDTQPAAPSPPPPPPAPVNQAPIIGSFNVTDFGVSGLTPIQMSATATDPEGDPVTYSWSWTGQTVPLQAYATVLSGDGPINLTLTVTDSKGASTTRNTTVNVGTMTGQWMLVPTNGASCGWFGYTSGPILTLSQAQRSVTGTLASPRGWCNVPGGQSGTIDPAAPGSIDAEGNFKARLKMGPFTDMFMTGKMEPSGREITVSASFQNSSGSFFFWLRKQ